LLKYAPLSRTVLERPFRKYLGRSPQAEIRAVQLKRERGIQPVKRRGAGRISAKSDGRRSITSH
jgi:hypothetical protein